MGSCSAKKATEIKIQASPTIKRSQSKKPVEFQQTVLDINSAIAQLTRPMENSRTQQQILSLQSIRSATETIMRNQERRQERQPQDAAFQYILYQQAEKMIRIIGDYLLIDAEFEIKYADLVPTLEDLVYTVDRLGELIRPQMTRGTQNTTGVSGFSNK